jgi:hypothetical protein
VIDIRPPRHAKSTGLILRTWELRFDESPSP